MKLDRNINSNGRGKYALLKLRRQPEPFSVDVQIAAEKLKAAGLLDFGDEPDTSFFVIRLKDKYAAPALAAYALAAYRDDPEYGLDVLNLAKEAAEHPNQKSPD